MTGIGTHAVETPVTVTARAARRIAGVLAEDGAANAFRVSVIGGGCSGFSYRFDLVNVGEPDDLVIDAAGARVLVDAVSVPYLAGSELDYVDDLIGQSFQIRNPNAVAACGCGTSFAV